MTLVVLYMKQKEAKNLKQVFYLLLKNNAIIIEPRTH